MKKLFLLLSLCCISLATWAESYTDENDVTWGYNLETQWDETTQTNVVTGAVITQCSNYGTEIVVPGTIQVGEVSYNVVSLEGTVFNDGRDQQGTVTSVTLPSTLKRIGWNVFEPFTSLKSLNIPEGVTSIGGDVFRSSSELVLTLPTSLQSVENGAFRGCKTVILPSTDPTSLGNNISIQNVFDEVSYIAVPDEAIETYKSSMTWTRYAEKICGHSEVVEYTYTDDIGVTWRYYYVLSTSSARIEKAEGYSTDIVVPGTLSYNDQQIPVTAIEHSFSGNESITTVDLSNVTITTIPSFSGCTSLTTILFPSTLEDIDEGAFYGNSNLQSIDLSETKVTEIKNSTFEYCSKLGTITFPSTLEKIGERAFYGNSNLQSIDLSETKVTEIKNSTFQGCSKLGTIAFPSTLEKIGEYAFRDCSNLQSIDLSATKVTEIKNSTFEYCSKLGTITFPSTLEKIGERAFYGNSNLQSIDLSETQIVELGNDAFHECGYITTVSLPASLKKIGERAFRLNYSLSSIDLSNVEEIGNAAFDAVRALTNVDISSAKIIGNDAFDADITFTINATEPAKISFNSFTENSKFIVSPNAYNAFCNAENWSRWIDNISMSNIDTNGIKWFYRYLQDSESICITGASNYNEEVTIPSTLPHNGNDVAVTHIGEFIFPDCESLTAVEIPASVTSIGYSSFYHCKNLANVTFEGNSALLSIGDWAFSECDALVSIEIPASVKTLGGDAFSWCDRLTTVLFEDNSAIEYIGNYAFYGSYALNNIDLSNVEVIGEGAFLNWNFTSIDLSSATSVGWQAFSANEGEEPFITINNTTPATIASGAFPESAMFFVPGSATTSYKSADVWSDYASRIFGREVATQTIEVTAQEDGSGVLEVIGNENQSNIVDLTVKGTINGYDFVMFKDKMPNLRFLDLSEVKIVENPYRYYESHYSQEDILGAYAFHDENKLRSIKLPKNIKYIGENAFANCNKLTEIVIPNTITSIANGAFANTGLTEIILPNKLEYIGSDAFSNTQLKEIRFPTTLTTIEWGAFQGCHQLETVRIPSSLQYISNYAFGNCSNLKNVYTYTIEPTDINENTFSNFETVQLYVPTASGQNYYWDEGWKRFINVAEFDEEYEYFYLNNDHTLDESTGAIDGTPDADLNAGSGLTVEDGVEQNMGDLNIQHDGTNGGSIIAGSEDGNIHADNLHVNINVESGRWYFFCFPFDLNKENISMGKEETQYIFRWYDGKERANGNSGWKNVTEEEGSYLKAAVGYIFQCSQSDVLTISLQDVKFKKEKKYNELVANTAENLQDASWNFVGNPYLSYYDMNSVGYDAPITVWNGETYEAIKPGDDDYHFAPFEAFFVQKPEDTDAMEFDADAQTTLQGSQTETRASGARSITRAFNPDRRLINIVLSNGKASDRTRIVFNDKVSMEYELACDAAKFDAAGVPQLYTLDNRAVKYAINERPVAEGIVTLGYSVPAEGNYTLEAPRMDTKVYVKDNLTRIIHDFSEGSYEFYSEAGAFENRFTILTRSGATGIDKVGLDEQNDEIYNLNGQRINKATGKGIYIKNNRKEINM